jgi:hypothetical protein
MHLPKSLQQLRENDRGLGMVTVVLAAAVLGALTLVVTTVTFNNLENTRRDRQALAALATSEAGVARAISHLRTGNLGALKCDEPAGGGAPTDPDCLGTTESWISYVAPKHVRLDGTTGACTNSSDCYRVWIGTVKPYVPNCPERHATPPRPCTGIYRVHSTGVSGNGPGARQITTDVEVQPYSYPLGVFAENFSGSGQLGVHKQSLFTNGCVQNRVKDNSGGSGVRFDWDATNSRPVIDLIYDQPSTAHATGDISTSNNSCGSGSGGAPIHNSSVKCNADFPWDQSGNGAPLPTTSPCYGKYVRSDMSVYPTSSAFTSTELAQVYGYRPRGLTDAQFDALKSQAVSQGTYNIATGNISSRLTTLVGQGVTSPVLFWDIGNVALKQTDFPAAFSRGLSTDAGCTSNSVTIIVVGGNLSYQGGNTSPYLTAAIFVPDGLLTGTGGRNTIGTVFAQNIDLSGSVDFFMDECFAANPPGAVVDAEVVDWRESDSSDFN